MGFVAAFSRARDEKGFREWPSHIDRDARSQMRDPLRTLDWRALLLPPLLEGVADNVAPGVDFGLFPDMERADSIELAPSSAWPGPCRAFSLLKTRRPSCAIPSWSGKLWQRSRGRPFLSRYRRFQACVATARAASCEGGDDEHGIFGRDAGFAYRACVRGDRRALAGCFPCCGPWRRRCRPSRITRKTLDPRPPLTPRSRRRVRRRRGTSRRLTPQGAGVSRASAPTPSPGAPLTLRPCVIAQ